MPSEKKLAEETDMIEARQQYAALCYRLTRSKKKTAIEVLLITSRDTGRWVTPKGWPMANKAPHEVAAQEAFEEAGIKGKVAEKPLGNYSYLKRLDNGTSVPCVVDLYPLRVRKAKSKYPEADERTRKWTTPEEAAELVHESELKTLLIELINLLEG
ncbi:NUDIX hydrolase [Martelella radicis]|uniref:8-oxo-dGTP pyrophosphatase MutT (NUDIX family) n=1 Tax=Martelella radicis TaxID=1397476 RepID=A0A7W6KMS6_9HYPH|nr:NUDIX hydrolase [Martelella radicis]MBB4124068.1 8-oxo-dGTP pyrophosphatase MutT (NUDIX family) [Martelella radicis]